MNNMKYNENPLIDLHTHSCYSDGELKPIQLVNLAIEKGISTLSITDHDTLLGNQEIFSDYKKNLAYINLIPGIELSAKTDKDKMHILGYGINIYDEALNKKMNELRNKSINYFLSLIEQMKTEFNIFFTYEEIKDIINDNHNYGRPDIAKLCIKNGYAKTIGEAFDKYLNDVGLKIRNKNKGLYYDECIDLILKSGGIPVLAHPKRLKKNEQELFTLISDMKRLGLQGIEVYHSTHSESDTKQYIDIANKLDLLISGGTDYHGPNVKADIEIGTGKNNNVKIKRLSILNRLPKN